MTNSPSESDELLRVMRELKDRQDILDVIHRESRGRDRQDVDLIASCWWEDGIDEHGPMIVGAADYPARANAGHARFFSATMHHLTTHTCEIEGNTAHAETYVIGTMLSPDKQAMKIAPGRYFDRLEKRGGEWRILFRRCTVEMSMDGSAEWVNGPMCKGFLRSVWSKEDKSYQRPIEVGTDGERW